MKHCFKENPLAIGLFGFIIGIVFGAGAIYGIIGADDPASVVVKVVGDGYVDTVSADTVFVGCCKNNALAGAIALDDRKTGWVDKHSTDSLNVYTPHFSRVDFVCQRKSVEDDDNAIWGCAGAFTSKEFNTEGLYVSNGEKGGSFWRGRGGFAFFDSIWVFCQSDKYEAVAEKATQKSGMAFQQEMIILDGENVYNGPHKGQKNIYRTLCERKDQLLFIESKTSLSMEEFINCLKAYGVENAIYLDMGGWRYSWYRDEKGIIIRNHKNADKAEYSNWVVCYK